MAFAESGPSPVPLLQDIEAKLDDPAHGLAEIKAQIAAFNPVFQGMPDAILSQPNPASDTWYTILDSTPNVETCFIAAKTIGGTASSLVVRVTVDGKQIFHTRANPTTDIDYMPTMNYGSGTQWLDANQDMTDDLATAGDDSRIALKLASGRNVKVEVKVVWTVAVTTLAAIVKYKVIPF